MVSVDILSLNLWEINKKLNQSFFYMFTHFVSLQGDICCCFFSFASTIILLFSKKEKKEKNYF